MTDVWFYHLERQPLDHVLSILLQRTLDRGWRACVEASSAERVAALDEALWTYDDASFLPHGVAGEGNAAEQPILLTDRPHNPNGATIRFLVDGADPLAALAGKRIRTRPAPVRWADDEAVADARRRWSALKAAGHSVTYWQQDIRRTMGQAGLKRLLILGTALAALLLADSAAMARHRMSFVPGRHGHGYAAVAGPPRCPRAGAAIDRRAMWLARHGPARRGGGADEGTNVPPPPGSGFKMEDGVLTYPAPARFQPKNLKHL